jgi:polyhydroxybutyrate depolymerase
VSIPPLSDNVRATRHRLARRVLLCAASGSAVALSSLVGVTPSAAIAATAAPGRCGVATGEYTFTHKGEDRVVRYFIPAGATTGTAAVVSLHGAGGGDAAKQENGTQFSAIGARRGFIAIYPQARSEHHSDVWDVRPGGGDADFVGAVVADLHARGCASPRRTFVNGFSMGAMLASRLMCERGHLFGGATMVAGVLPPTRGCRVAATSTILIMHGYRDPVVDWYGGLAPPVQAVTGRWAVFPFNRRFMAYKWAVAKGCTEKARRTQRGMTITVDYGCRGGGNTTVLGFLTGGHSWTFPDRRINTSQFINWTMKMGPTRRADNAG